MRNMIRMDYEFYGRVQGVGFRYHAQYAASRFCVTGWVTNCYDGSVRMQLQGTKEQLEQVLQSIYNARFVSVERVESKEIPTELESTFRVR